MKNKKISSIDINDLFLDYYKEHREVATHVFIYSKKQDKIHEGFDLESKHKNTVLGVIYTEMRSRDALNDEFIEDAILIGVGRLEDIKRI